MMTLIITNYTTGKKSKSTLSKTFDNAHAIVTKRLAKLANEKNRFDAVLFGNGQQVAFREGDF